MAFDLSAYAGQQVEVIVSYVTDPFTGGTGAIIDDTRLVTTAGVVEAEGSRAGSAPGRSPAPRPAAPPNAVDWELTGGVGDEIITAAVATEDSVMFGFGLEQLAAAEAREAVVAPSSTTSPAHPEPAHARAGSSDASSRSAGGILPQNQVALLLEAHDEALVRPLRHDLLAGRHGRREHEAPAVDLGQLARDLDLLAGRDGAEWLTHTWIPTVVSPA